ncbi:MAG: pitrilysin family protein [Bacteroidota bacterium]
MYRIYSYVFTGCVVLLATLSGSAQIDRTKAPQPGPAPKVKLGDYKSFTLDNGLTVFVVENHKVPRVSFQLTIDRAPILEGDRAGYVSLAGQLLKAGGTTTRTKAQLDEAIDFIGGSISTSSRGMSGVSLTKHSETLLTLMADILLHPEFRAEELEKLRKQTLSNLAASQNNPDAISAKVGAALIYGKNHPYGEVTSEATVGRVQREDIVNYYQTHFKPNAAYLVVVGDISPKAARKLVTRFFSEWERGEVPGHQHAFPERPSGTRVAFVDRPGAVQSVISVSVPVALKPGSPNEIPAVVMNNILGGGAFKGRLMQNLREDKGYTYGARSSLESDKLVGEFKAFASVRNAVTDSAITEFLAEMQRMRQEPVTAEELAFNRNQLGGSFARSLENPQTIANFALSTTIHNLPKDYYHRYLETMSAVDEAAVQRMADQFILPDQALILVVGNREEVADDLARFAASGMVEHFDAEGNPVKTGLRPAPEGVTGQAVMEKYIAAIGGAAKLGAVKDISVRTDINMGGVVVQGELLQKAPNKVSNAMYMNGSLMQKQTYDGKVGRESGYGGEREISGPELNDVAQNAILFPELSYENRGYQLVVRGIATINGRDAYRLDAIQPGGRKKDQHYYDAETGLRVRVLQVMDGQGGSVTMTTDLSDYREVAGILFPFSMEQNVGGQVVKVTVKEVKVDSGLEDQLFQP